MLKIQVHGFFDLPFLNNLLQSHF